MKKHMLLSLAFSTCLILSACSQEETPAPVVTPTPEVTVETPTIEAPVEKDTTEDFIIETQDIQLSDENLALEGVELSQKVTLVDYVGSDTHIVIPEGVEAIGEAALRMGQFESIVFPSTLEIIGREACFNNAYLSSIVLPEGLLIIDGSAFQYCHALESIQLPSTLKGMTTASFGGTGLTTVRLPSDMDYLTVGIFYESEGMTSAEVKTGSQTAEIMSPLALMVGEEIILTPTYID